MILGDELIWLTPYKDMARPLRIEIPGGVYHVAARGNGRQTIFRDNPDRLAFLDLGMSPLNCKSKVKRARGEALAMRLLMHDARPDPSTSTRVALSIAPCAAIA